MEPHSRCNKLAAPTESAREQRVTHIHLGPILSVRPDTPCLAAPIQLFARTHTVRKVVATMTARVALGSGQRAPLGRGTALTLRAHGGDLSRPIRTATCLPVIIAADTPRQPVRRPRRDSGRAVARLADRTWATLISGSDRPTEPPSCIIAHSRLLCTRRRADRCGAAARWDDVAAECRAERAQEMRNPWARVMKAPLAPQPEDPRQRFRGRRPLSVPAGNPPQARGLSQRGLAADSGQPLAVPAEAAKRGDLVRHR
jgi:hypothetical protein